MMAEFDPEFIAQQVNETGEDFGVDLVDRNETVEEEPAQNGTMQSVPASDLDLGWSKAVSYTHLTLPTIYSV